MIYTRYYLSNLHLYIHRFAPNPKKPHKKSSYKSAIPHIRKPEQSISVGCASFGPLQSPEMDKRNGKVHPSTLTKWSNLKGATASGLPQNQWVRCFPPRKYPLVN